MEIVPPLKIQKTKKQAPLEAGLDSLKNQIN
jgi:hypothetical protein